MKLFIYKTDNIKPLIFLICKLSSKEEFDKLEAISCDIFSLLIEHDYANKENILIFSVIKDFDKKTINLILPSIHSDEIMTKKCQDDTQFINELITNLLKYEDSEVYMEILNSKIIFHEMTLNLGNLSNYFSQYHQ